MSLSINADSDDEIHETDSDALLERSWARAAIPSAETPRPWSVQHTLSQQHRRTSNCAADEDDEAEARSSLRRLVLATVLCTLFMAGELVAGYLSDSVAIWGDALHILSDISGFLVSIVAIYLARRPATQRLSFGFYRAEIVGAILSVLIIWVLTGFLLKEAVERVMQPEDNMKTSQDGMIMSIVAIAGIVLNLILGFVLFQGGHGHSHGGGGGHGHSHGPMSSENINVRSAYIHVLGDLLQTIGVLIAGVIIWIKPEYQIADPICTFVFSVIVLYTTIHILRDAFHVLMEGTPAGVDIERLYAQLGSIKNIVSVHDLHVWSLTMGKPSLSVHIEVGQPEHMLDTLRESEALICREWGIHHTTIQVEPVDSGQHHCGSCSAPMVADARLKIAPTVNGHGHSHDDNGHGHSH